MLTLAHIYPRFDWQQLANIPFSALKLDSRTIAQGDGFVLLKSAVGHSDDKSLSYAKSVQDKAAFILSEVDLSGSLDGDNLRAPWVYMPNIRNLLGDLKHAELQAETSVALPKVIAVTGTNGKTTVTTLVAQLLTELGKATALLGTAGNGIYPQLTQASHTTGDVFSVQTHVHNFAKQGADYLCVEASSHGLDQVRLQGLPISVGVYTNLSRDHLDYHANMAEYAAAKAKLFGFQTLSHAIINADDDYADIMTDAAQAHHTNIWRYSARHTDAEFYAHSIRLHGEGISAALTTPVGDMHIDSPLLGRFNLANLVACVATGLALGFTLADIEKTIPKLTGAAGRMQRISHAGTSFLVDYAHTPDALAQVLSSLREHCTGSRLWVVFGCGGNRDKGKRPQMMQAALNHADRVVVTADNPRDEAPEDIAADMLAGLSADQQHKVHIELDRKHAIAYAIAGSQSGDVVVVAGKGHETYQEIAGIRHDFDDMQVLKQLLAKRHNP